MKMNDSVVDKAIHDSHETDSLLQRMGEIRDDLDEGVQDIVEQAREMRDWRTYMNSHPWVFVGAAVAVGYIIVPRRPNRVDSISKVQPQSSKSARVLGFVGMMVLREVVSYVGRQASQSFMEHGDRSQISQTSQDIKP